jgi:tetratricopeptide (TPR) repeat protein
MNVISLAAAAMTVLICAIYGMEAALATEAFSVPPATLLAADTAQVTATIRSLEEKVKQNPDDFIAYTKLAGYYLQRQRETGSSEYITLAGRAAHASLAILPPEQNYGGLATLAQAEYALHDFTAARDHAMQLTKLDPTKGSGFEILSDALIELGEYNSAQRALDQLQRLAEEAVGTQTRLGKYALLRGRPKDAAQYLSRAVVLALEQSPPQREPVAWCRWQLGETAFAIGDYATAEQHYRDALTTFPDYFRALASLGRVRAARGDLVDAIEQYEHAVRIVPDPLFVAALGDLYKLADREKDAATQYALVEQIARLNALGGLLYNRQQALFYADHDLKPQEAYENATKEYAVRRDIYGADAVAWTALKAGKLAEAQVAMREALRLGTRDAKLFYHAGMIARAAGNNVSARDYLKRALSLSPQFDPLQALVAKERLNASPETKRNRESARVTSPIPKPRPH